jgi:hypothetical protein
MYVRMYVHMRSRECMYACLYGCMHVCNMHEYTHADIHTKVLHIFQNQIEGAKLNEAYKYLLHIS